MINTIRNRALVFMLGFFMAGNVFAKDLTFKLFAGAPPGMLATNAFLMIGEKQCALFDGQWLPVDGERLADMIEETGCDLKYVFITHGHPDHYMGLGPVEKRFPDARILARQGVRDYIVWHFPAKRLHWQEAFPKQLPLATVDPEVFKGESVFLEEHEIKFIDLPPAESFHATAFYIPSAKALISGDLVMSQVHMYFADLNAPTAWINALKMVQKVGPIEVIYPGHGKVSGPEIFNEAIGYLEYYREVAKPDVRVPDIARAMVKRYPHYAGPEILWLTMGPGYGLSGAREFGVPPEFLPPPPEGN